MLSENAGFDRLMHMCDLLKSSGQDMTLLNLWYDRRWEELNGRLNEWAEDPKVAAFISAYASSLADSMAELMTDGSIAEAAEALVDFLEELFSQTGSYSTSTKAEGPVPPRREPELPNMPIATDLAQAA